MFNLLITGGQTMSHRTKTTLGDQISESTLGALAGVKEQLEAQTATDGEAELDEVCRPEEFANMELGKDEYTLNDLMNIDATKIPFLVEGLIPKNNLTVLAGPSDVGKSTLYTQLVAGIISGESTFLWRKLHTNKRNVLVVSTEDDEVVFSIRIKRQLEGEVPSQKQGNRLRFWPRGHNIVDRLESFLNNRRVDLVVIDSLSDVFKGDMNSGNATREFLGKLSGLAKKHRTSVLVVHHARKTDSEAAPNKDKLLGSVGIEGLARSVLFMTRTGNDPTKRALHVVKGNYVEDQFKTRSDVLLFEKETLTFTKIEDTDRRWTTSQGISKPGVKIDDEKVALARRLRGDGKTLEEIGSICGKDKSSISRWLNPKGHKFIVDESFVVP